MKRLIQGSIITGIGILTFAGMSHVAFATTNGVQPQRVIDHAGWIFDSVSKKESGTFKDIVNGTRYWNTTKDDISYTSTFSGSHTNSASASLGGGWGPVNTTIGFNVNTSYTWSYSEAVKVIVRPGYEGWNEYGVGRDEWHGHYYYVDEYGNESSSKWINVYSPRYKVVKAVTKYKGM